MQAIVPGPSGADAWPRGDAARSQARTGSTSTRRRPGGRATDDRRSHNAPWSGARTDHVPSTGPLTSTPSGAARRNARPVGLGRGARHERQGAERGEAPGLGAPPLRLPPGPRGRPTPRPRGRGAGAGASGRPHAPGRGRRRARGPTPATSRARSGQERQCLLGGAEPGGEELGVELQERHRVGIGHPVQRRLGAHHDPSTAEVVLLRVGRTAAGPHTSATATPARASRSSRRRVTPSRSAFMRVAPHRRTPPGVPRRSAGNGATGPRPEPGPERASPTASHQVGAFSPAPPPARQQHHTSRTAPALRTPHTTATAHDRSGSRHTPPGVRAPRSSRVRAARGARRTSPYAGRRRDGRSPRPRANPGAPTLRAGSTSGPTARISSVGHGDTSAHGASVAPGTLDHHRPRRPRRGALFVVGLVVGVEHDGGGEPRHGREGRRARARPTTHPPARARAQSPGSSAVATPAALSRRATSPAPAVARSEHERAGVDPGTVHVAPRRRRRWARDRSPARAGPRSFPRPSPARGRGDPRDRRAPPRGGGDDGEACAPPPTRRPCAGTSGPDPPSATPPTEPASSTGGGGPQPRTAEIGRNTTPGGGTTWSSTTHPPTRRPPSTTRTCDPTRTSSARASGTV